MRLSRLLLSIVRCLLLCFCALSFSSVLYAQTSRPRTEPPKKAAETRASSLPVRRNSTSQPAAVSDLAALFRRTLRHDLQPSTMFRPLPFELPLAPSDATYNRAFAIASSMKLTHEDQALLASLEIEAQREWREETMQRPDVRHRMHRHLRLYGLAKYRLLGFLRLKQLEEALARFFAQGGSLLHRPATHSPAFQKTLVLARYAGNYLSLFSRIGLQKNAKKLSQEQRYWMRTLFLARWANQVVGVFPLPVLMGGPIYADYTRARLLFSTSAERRLWAARELLSIDPTLDSARIVVWLWIQLRQPQMALRYLHDTLRKEPQYRSAQQLLLHITQETSSSSPTPPRP